jgi:RecJ-like exonuclease
MQQITSQETYRACPRCNSTKIIAGGKICPICQGTGHQKVPYEIPYVGEYPKIKDSIINRNNGQFDTNCSKN